mmetsp:Transcript_9087/g.28144  ORF Transcript_9087/g.28144 Transcript_9087/m.28144 type:complete len:205 (+) Transcript_9087:2233-2847(+)
MRSRGDGDSASNFRCGREVADQRLAVDELLRDHARDGDHGQAAVRQLAQAHLLKLLRVVGCQAQRVECQIARRVVVLEQPEALAVVGVVPALLHARRLGNGHDEGDDLPEEGRHLLHLLEVADGRAGDVLVEEERAALHLLAHEKADRGQHRHAAVRQLRLAVAQQPAGVGALGELERVKVGAIEGRDGARQLLHEVRAGLAGV